MINSRIVITGVGLTSPNGNNLKEFRHNLLNGVSGVREYETRYMGKVLAGVCDFDELKYQKKKERRRGTRVGSVSIYCSREAFADSGLDLESIDRSRIGVYLGTTEHGNVETENEVYNISKYDYDVKYWSHHHNPRTVSNNPAGEVTLNMKITGPHYTIGAACAAGTLELSGNLPAFEDNMVHPTINLDDLDPECAVNNLVANEPEKLPSVNYIMNNSFGMFGINSVLIVKKFVSGN